MISFPNINPTAFSFFGIDIQWYGIAYASRFIIRIILFKKINKNKNTLQKEFLMTLFFGLL